MKLLKTTIQYFSLCILCVGFSCSHAQKNTPLPTTTHQVAAQTVSYRNQQFDVCKVAMNTVEVALYLSDQEGNQLKSIKRLKTYLENQNKELLFATNAGMYRPNHLPQGLYVENGKAITPLLLGKGKGNFFMKPNGVFLLTKDAAFVIKSEAYQYYKDQTVFATQSGPLLVYNDTIHPAFNEGSSNLHIRSGVGVNEQGELVFAISKKRVNFYDFALLFKEHFGCKNALYLDGFVSQMYLPAINRLDSTGNFGAMIGITPKKEKQK